MKYQENHLKLKHPVQYETGFFTTTPPSSLFSYAAFLDLPSHLDDTKMAMLAGGCGGHTAAKHKHIGPRVLFTSSREKK